jgi:hypothetical protein
MSASSYILSFVVIAAMAAIGYFVYRKMRKPTKPSVVLGTVRDVQFVRAQQSRSDAFSEGRFVSYGIADELFEFTWSPPATGASTGYTVTYTYTLRDPAGNVSAKQTTSQTKAPLPTPLQEGDYTITVYASNQFGDGPSTTATGSTHLTPGSVSGIALQTPFISPSDSYSFVWSAAPPGAASLPAQISYKYVITDPTGKQSTGTTSQTTVDLPLPVVSGTYSISVQAVNQFGAGSAATFSGLVKLMDIQSFAAQWRPFGGSHNASQLQLVASVSNMTADDTMDLSLNYSDGSPVYANVCGAITNKQIDCTAPDASGSRQCYFTLAYDADPSYTAPCAKFDLRNNPLAVRGGQITATLQPVSSNANEQLAPKSKITTRIPGSVPSAIAQSSIVLGQ